MCLQYLLHLNESDVPDNLNTITEQISKAGAIVSSYIPDNTILVVAQPGKLEALKQVAGVFIPWQFWLATLQRCIVIVNVL